MPGFHTLGINLASGQTTMRFTKMHGIGNDFVMINCLGKEGAALAEEAERRAAFLNDRKFGVGGDGVIVHSAGTHGPVRHADVQSRRLRSRDVRQRHSLLRQVCG